MDETLRGVERARASYGDEVAGRLAVTLQAFALVADAWLDAQTYLRAYYQFYQEFFLREQLEAATWEDFQQVGDHIHAFNAFDVARKRAFGHPNHPIEHYREVFMHLAHDEGLVRERIRAFMSDPAHDLRFVGEAAKSEIVGNLFAETFIPYNKRDRWAVLALGVSLEERKSDTFAERYLQFNERVEPILDAYQRIVGQRTELPVSLEVDQYFSWLYETHRDRSVEGVEGHGVLRAPAEILAAARAEAEAQGEGGVDAAQAPDARGSGYGLAQALDGVFIEAAQFEALHALLRRKKNLIVQGPPGVGKTFLARRLALLLTDGDEARVRLAQLHQSYGYEDFVQGFRPTTSGGFVRKDGIFLRLCREAAARPSRPHVLIIDEINRGNVSKVFGELLMLIEADKRGPQWATALAYHEDGEAPFHVPENLFLIGTMNTADRSLAFVDYALRRRFAFTTLRPAFGHAAFRRFLEARGVAPELVARLDAGMAAINARIASDTMRLGPGFCIGHSPFCAPARAYDVAWYENILAAEIAPLLQEYWFDDPDEAERLIEELRLER